MYDFTIAPDLGALSELEGTWRVPEDGAGEQLFTFDRAAKDSLIAILSWQRVDSGDSGNLTTVYTEGSSRTAVFYHYDHPDGTQEATYSKITWTEPLGDPLTTDIAIYENASSFDAALAEELLIDVGDPDSPDYPLPAKKE
jgi:hypothetical protein